MGAARRSCGLIILLPVLLLGACAPLSTPTPQSALEDLALDFTIKSLHALTDPDSLSPFSEPQLHVDCVSDAQHRDCCVATGRMQVDAPIQDVSEQLRDDLRQQVDGELAGFRILHGRDAALPRDTDWMVQVNEKIAGKILKEWFSQNPKLEAVFAPLVVTPEACQQMLNDAIARSFPVWWPEYYQGRAAAAGAPPVAAPPTLIPLLKPTPQPLLPWLCMPLFGCAP